MLPYSKCAFTVKCIIFPNGVMRHLRHVLRRLAGALGHQRRVAHRLRHLHPPAVSEQRRDCAQHEDEAPRVVRLQRCGGLEAAASREQQGCVGRRRTHKQTAGVMPRPDAVRRGRPTPLASLATAAGTRDAAATIQRLGRSSSPVSH